MPRRYLPLALIALTLALLLPQPAEAQNWSCDFSARLPSPLRLSWIGERQVTVAGHTLQLRFCAPHTQSVVAEDMLNLAVRALPELAQLTDVPLDGSHQRTFYLDESANVRSIGADGYIDTTSDQITLHPASRESTVVHELAHYWADPERFAEGWMVEAYAEYLTALAMPRLGLSYSLRGPLPVCDGLPLKLWRPGQRETVTCAYSVGPRVLQELAAQAGEETLRAVLGELSRQRGGVNSELLLTRLEQARPVNLTPLMRDRVFPPEERALLDERAHTRERYLVALDRARALGVGLPTAVADDLNAWLHGAAAAKLDLLEPVLLNAEVTSRRCAELELPCAPIWSELGPDPTSWSALGLRLADTPQLLGDYEQLRAATGGLGLPIPEALRQAAASLELAASPTIQAATATLARARELERRCAEAGLECRGRWLPLWERGEIDALAAALADLAATLDEAAKLEARCGPLAGRCRELWQASFNAEGPAAARGVIAGVAQTLDEAAELERDCGALAGRCRELWQAAFAAKGPGPARDVIAELSALLGAATELERDCGALAGRCRELWQAAFRGEAPGAARQVIAELNALVDEAYRIEAQCLAAGWPCAEGWRAALRAGDLAEARRILERQEAALPGLAAMATEVTPTGVALNADSGGAPGEDELAAARAAFAQGDVAAARALAEQLRERQRHALWRTIGLALLVAAAVLALAVVLFLAGRRRRPPPGAGPGASGGGAGGGDTLLAQLLDNPPAG